MNAGTALAAAHAVAGATDKAVALQDYGWLVYACAPQLVMTAIALAALLLDVFALRGADPARRAKIVGGLTAAGLVGVVVMIAQQDVYQQLHGQAPLFADAARVIVLNRLGLALEALVVIVTIATVVLSISYEFTKHVGEYFCLVVFAAVSMSFLVMTENLILIFVALELLSVCLYILTAFHKGLLRSSEAAVKYFMFGALSTAFLLFGLSYVVGFTGSTDLRVVARAITALIGAHQGAGPTGDVPVLIIVGMLFVAVGLGFKIAVVPFHLWAPDAYEGAPTPVAGFIATGSKVASFAVAAKILLVAFAPLSGSAAVAWEPMLRFSFAGAHLNGWTAIFAIVATASMVWGNVAAIVQRNVKRMLAYSSIAHAGYILLGVIAMNEAGMSAVTYYLFAYALTNVGAFGVVAVLTRAVRGDDIEDLDGLAQRAPLMSLLLLLFVLSLAGVPPLAGFFGKFLLFGAAVKADPHDLGLLWIVIVALATSAVSLYYYLAILKHVFVHAPRRAATIVTPWPQRFVLILVGVAVVALGAYPAPLVDLADSAVHAARLTSGG